MRRRTLLRSAAVAATTGVVGVAGASRHRGERTNPTDAQETTENGERQETTTAGADDAFSISSGAWENGGSIPTRFTCDGENVSPPLSISNPPERTRSLALVMDDPDAPDPPFVHWLLWDLSADTEAIPENVSTAETVESLAGAVQGANGTGELGYVGPCPPEDDPRHTYLFTLFALEEPLGLDPGAGYDEVLSALFPRAIARTRLVGQYDRGE